MATPPAAPAPPSEDDQLAQLERLGQLKAQGILTDDESRDGTRGVQIELFTIEIDGEAGGRTAARFALNSAFQGLGTDRKLQLLEPLQLRR